VPACRSCACCARITLSAPIVRVEAILNGTTNYVLDAIALGDSLPDAIAAAQLAGYAEADPSRDLDGRDAEAKLRILAWLAFGIDPRALHVTRRGVDNAVARWTRIAARSGDAVRILATLEVTAEGLRGTIRPVRVPANDAWAEVRGVSNRLVVQDAAGGVLMKRAGPWDRRVSVSCTTWQWRPTSRGSVAPSVRADTRSGDARKRDRRCVPLGGGMWQRVPARGVASLRLDALEESGSIPDPPTTPWRQRPHSARQHVNDRAFAP
jgi:hypothetical protein